MDSTAILEVCSAQAVLCLPWYALERDPGQLDGVGTVVFDLAGCDCIDSILLGRILHARVRLARRGIARFVFSGLEGRNRELLQLLHVDRLIALAA